MQRNLNSRLIHMLDSREDGGSDVILNLGRAGSVRLGSRLSRVGSDGAMNRLGNRGQVSW